MGDPAVASRNKVHDGRVHPARIWTKIEGLGFEYQITEYREGGRQRYTHKILGALQVNHLRLSRPVDSTSELLMLWLQSNMIAVIPQTMSITSHDRGRRGTSRPGTSPASCR